MHQVDTLLIKSERTPELKSVLNWLREGELNIGSPITSAFTHAAENGKPIHYLYLPFRAQQILYPDTLWQLHKLWHNMGNPPAELSRLQKILRLQGASSSQTPKAHYVVETRPEDGWDEEIAKWYAEEHLPGLARVPGTVLAERYINLDPSQRSPSSFACYNLTTPAVLSTPEWLTVRATPWSDICRPHFCDTLRTMFQELALTDPPAPTISI